MGSPVEGSEMMYSHLTRLGNIDYAHCERCGAKIDPDEGWDRGDYGEWFCQKCVDEQEDEEPEEET